MANQIVIGGTGNQIVIEREDGPQGSILRFTASHEGTPIVTEALPFMQFCQQAGLSAVELHQTADQIMGRLMSNEANRGKS